MFGVGGQVAGIVGESAHIRGYRRNGRFVGQVVVVPAEKHRLVGQVVVAFIPGVELRVGLRIACEVAGIVGEGTHIGRHRRDVALCGHARLRQGGHHGRHRCGVQVVCNLAAETIARLFGVQGVWHTQQLLHADHRVVVTTVGVRLGFQEPGTVCPVEVGEGALLHRAAADFHRQQAICIGGGGMGFHVERIARRAALQDAHPHTDLCVDNQLVASIANHRLKAELFGCLGEQTHHSNHHNDK